MDHLTYNSIDKDIGSCHLTAEERQWLNENKPHVIDTLRSIEDKQQPRQDYLEFLKLSLLTLGEGNMEIQRFTPPGAYHAARWMAKGIYCLKIFLFCDQFTLSRHEQQSLKRICLFTVTIYVEA
jgi:hypothetical protein